MSEQDLHWGDTVDSSKYMKKKSKPTGSTDVAIVLSHNPTPMSNLGPSSELIARIHHLQCLLENLPDQLPLNPVESTYQFRLDMEHVAEEGMWYVFNRSLEVCFEMHKIPAGGTIISENEETSIAC